MKKSKNWWDKIFGWMDSEIVDAKSVKQESYRNGLEAGFAIAQAKIRKMAIVDGSHELARKIRKLKLVKKDA